MQVTIARVHENLFSGEAVSLSARTTDGDVTILPNHEPYVANLAPGVVTVRTKEGPTNFEIDGGILEVSGNQATVLL
jgi:F-type H+-transporting ATPase subunit epsilon